MAGNAEGALKTAAKLRGLTVEEYKARAATEKWCRTCGEWHAHAEFGADPSRGDGLSTVCTASRRVRERRPRTVQRSLVPARRVVARDGDRRQARRTVNAHVEAGRWSAPNESPCVDCGHEWAPGERRHEFDHHLGYAPEHHESVEVVCTSCHHERELRRTS